MIYLVFAGGYGRLRNELGRPIAKQEGFGADVKSSDSIIAVEGFPFEEFFPPAEIKEVAQFRCKVCNRLIPEVEMEHRIGCFGHDREIVSSRSLKIWPNEYEEYHIPRLRWLNPAYRINLANTQGKEKFHQVWRYIQMNYPSNKMLPMPVPMAQNRRESYVVYPEDVPIIELQKTEAPPTSTLAQIPQTMFSCDVCGMKFSDRRKLRMHRISKHERKRKQLETAV